MVTHPVCRSHDPNAGAVSTQAGLFGRLEGQLLSALPGITRVPILLQLTGHRYWPLMLVSSGRWMASQRRLWQPGDDRSWQWLYHSIRSYGLNFGISWADCPIVGTESVLRVQQDDLLVPIFTLKSAKMASQLIHLII